MLLRDLYTCAGLASKQHFPVSATVLGILASGVSYKRPVPFFLDRNEIGFRSEKYYEELISQRECREVPIHLFEFRNALVFGQGTVVIGNKHVILDSAAEFINHSLPPDGMTKNGDELDLIAPVHVRELSGVSILVKRPWYQNFGHWLVDLMPILPMLYAEAVTADRIIFGDVKDQTVRTIMESTARTFYPNAEILFADDVEHLRCERLLYVEPVHVPPLFKHPLAIAATIEASRQMFPFVGGHNLPRRIYIRRRMSSARTISNDTEVTACLERHGFKTLHPEDYDFSEQIARFEAAEVVVGVKGAGLTNAMFCKPNAHVLVLSPPDFVDTFFWDLLAQRNINYSEIFCKATSNMPSVNPSQVDFEVAIDKIERFISRIAQV